jgi:hypothetical protein
VVRLPSTGIARQSTAELTEELRSVDSPSPLHIFPFFLRTFHSPRFPGARAPRPVPSLGPRWPTAVEPCHRSTISDGELALEPLLAVLVGPLSPPRNVKCEDEDLTADDLANGEIPTGQALP